MATQSSILAWRIPGMVEPGGLPCMGLHRVGKIEGKRRRGQQSIRWLDSITNSKDMNLSKLWETVEDRGA